MIFYPILPVEKCEVLLIRNETSATVQEDEYAIFNENWLIPGRKGFT